MGELKVIEENLDEGGDLIEQGNNKDAIKKYRDGLRLTKELKQIQPNLFPYTRKVDWLETEFYEGTCNALLEDDQVGQASSVLRQMELKNRGCNVNPKLKAHTLVIKGFVLAALDDKNNEAKSALQDADELIPSWEECKKGVKKTERLIHDEVCE